MSNLSLAQAEKEKAKELADSFEPHQVKKRDGDWNGKLGRREIYSYVDAEAVVARLRKVLGLRFRIEVPGLENGPAHFIVSRDNGKHEYIVGVKLYHWDAEIQQWIDVPGVGGKTIDAKKDMGDAFKAALSKAVKSAAKLLGVPIDGGVEEDEELETDASASDSSASPFGSVPTQKAPPTPPAQEQEAKVSSAPPTPPAQSSPFASSPAATKPAEVIPPPPVQPAAFGAQKTDVPAPPSAQQASAAPPPPPSQPSPFGSSAPPTPPATSVEAGDSGETCERCSGKIVPSTDENGKSWSVQEIIKETVEGFGMKMCVDCVLAVEEE